MTVESLLKRLEEKDPNQLAHAKRVSELMKKCLVPFKLKKSEVDFLTTTALLHDIGILEISGDLIKKESRLSLDEYEQIQSHVTLGIPLIKNLPKADEMAKIIRSHHENVNGFGYPDGLEGDQIPFGAKLLHILEAFDSMTSPRPGKKTTSTPEQAVAELKEYAGRIYDAEILAKIEGILLQ